MHNARTATDVKEVIHGGGDAIDTAVLSDWAACWLYLCRAEAFVSLRLLPEARREGAAA